MVEGQILSNAMSVVAGWGQSQALRADGSLTTWGSWFDAGRSVVQIQMGDVLSVAGWSSFAVKRDGTVVNILDGKALNGISNIVALSATPTPRQSQLLALRGDGVAIQIRLASPPASSIIASNAISIAAGGWQNLALIRDGTVHAWGAQNHLPAGLTNVVAISVGNYHSLALRSDGTLVGWGAADRPTARIPPGLSNIVAIAAGNDFSLAITTNRTVAERFMKKQ